MFTLLGMYIEIKEAISVDIEVSIHDSSSVTQHTNGVYDPFFPDGYIIAEHYEFVLCNLHSVST